MMQWNTGICCYKTKVCIHGFLRVRKRWDCIQWQCTQCGVFQACLYLPWFSTAISHPTTTKTLCFYQSWIYAASWAQISLQDLNHSPGNTNRDLPKAEHVSFEELASRHKSWFLLCGANPMLSTAQSSPGAVWSVSWGSSMLKKRKPPGLRAAPQALGWPSNQCTGQKDRERSIQTCFLSLYHCLLPKDVLRE